MTCCVSSPLPLARVDPKAPTAVSAISVEAQCDVSMMMVAALKFGDGC
jgi:hypothetical protein